MDGDGHSSKPTLPISRSQRTTKKTAWVVMFQLSQPTGYTCKATRSSSRNNQNGPGETHSEIFRRRIAMQKHLFPIIVLLGLTASSVYLLVAKPVVAAQSEQSSAVFDPDGKLELPAGFRKWVFVGAPLTPNALNNGKANFPEYHHVYVEQKNVDAYLKTGEFPEGTVIVKELTRVLNPTFPDGSRTEPSGRGYFNGQYNGIDLTVKDSKRFAKTNGWGF